MFCTISAPLTMLIERDALKIEKKLSAAEHYRRWTIRTFALDAVHKLQFVDVVTELMCGVVVAMRTDGAVQLQRVSVEPATPSHVWRKSGGSCASQWRI